LLDAHYSFAEQWVSDWEPVVDVKFLDVKALIASGSVVMRALSAQAVLKEAAISGAPFDHYAAAVSNPELSGVVQKLFPQCRLPPVTEAGSVPPSYVTTEMPKRQTEAAVSGDEMAIRVNAIREHIEESRLQNRALAFSCKSAYDDICVRGLPNKNVLVKKAELLRNPDFWNVVNGVIVESLLGQNVENFTHSAVYHPRPDVETGEVIRAVHRSDWKGKDGSGIDVENKNFVLADNTFSGWVLTTDDLQVYNGPEIVAALEKSLSLVHDYKIRLYWGPPGCGKTYSIVHAAKDDGTDAVMCPVRESIEDTRSQMVDLYPSFEDPRRYVRTVDSYLVNLFSDKKTGALQVDRLLADECYMTHAGKWYAAAALLGVKELWAYGDDKQIPHIPRVEAPKLHVKIKHAEVLNEFTTRRCPATAVAAWGGQYDWKVRTRSKLVGVMEEVRDTRGKEVPDGCVMMCMYQADKRELKKLYANDLKRVKIMTAHESEGKTFKHVWLHRFDARKRSDKFSLFDQAPHVLVAMSRHTDTFLYRCPAPLGDLVSQWVERSKDVRRLAAAADLSTAGKSIEKV
jgi:hypothetical protein